MDAQYYSQPVVLLDADGEPMSLDQQLQYMRERAGKFADTDYYVYHLIDSYCCSLPSADKYQDLFLLVESAVKSRKRD